MRSVILLSLSLAPFLLACTKSAPPEQTGTPANVSAPIVDNTRNNAWYQQADQGIQQSVEVYGDLGKAKNIILFIGDGMGISTLTAARIFEGQQRGESGEENSLSFERFPYSGLVKTYNVDAQTPDSAGTMTAIITGVKTNSGVLSMDEYVSTDDCVSQQDHELSLIHISEPTRPY